MNSLSLRYRDLPAHRLPHSGERSGPGTTTVNDLELDAALAPEVEFLDADYVERAGTAPADGTVTSTIDLAADVRPRVCTGPVWDVVIDRLMLSFREVADRGTISEMVSRAGEDLCCAAPGALPELVERLVRQRLADVASLSSVRPEPAPL